MSSPAKGEVYTHHVDGGLFVIDGYENNWTEVVYVTMRPKDGSPHGKHQTLKLGVELFVKRYRFLAASTEDVLGCRLESPCSRLKSLSLQTETTSYRGMASMVRMRISEIRTTR